MNASSLTLRLSRRALAAAAFSGDAFTYCDGRHLTSRRDGAVSAALRYVERVLDLTLPNRVMIDAPARDGGTTKAILSAVSQLLDRRNIQWHTVRTVDLLQAYGSPALHSRTELRKVTESFWESIPPTIGKVLPFVLDAAAAALHAETEASLAETPT